MIIVNEHIWELSDIFYVCIKGGYFGNTLYFNCSILTTNIHFPRNESKTTRFLDGIKFTILSEVNIKLRSYRHRMKSLL